MKRIFRVKIMLHGQEQTMYLRARKAREVRERLVRNGHDPSVILSITAIADYASPEAGIPGVVR